MKLKDLWAEIKEIALWHKYRFSLTLMGVKRIEFHSYGRLQTRADQIAWMKIVKDADWEPSKLGDSKGLRKKPRSIFDYAKDKGL
jgi:hypothetical protein